MSAPTLTQAVQLVWASIPTQTPALPALWLAQLPTTADQLPAAVYVHKGEATPRGNYSTAATKPGWIDGVFDIELYYGDVVQLETWARAIMTTFDAYFKTTPLDLDSSQHGKLWRTNYLLEPTGLVDANQNPVRKLTISYAAFIGNPAA